MKYFRAFTLVQVQISCPYTEGSDPVQGQRPQNPRTASQTTTGQILPAAGCSQGYLEQVRSEKSGPAYVMVPMAWKEGKAFSGFFECTNR